ncbi:hypothetical protein HDU93_007211 [Gonapodya sp. JEL0774]|nr:hypothetical protein HDU93_007211 [Gonapodya sp. JEL0774]
MSDLDAQLIDAVENGNVVEVRRLLAAGAKVTTRKKVSIRVTVGSEVKTDTNDCESCITLAIMHGHLDVVRALLEARADGFDVNDGVTWTIANCNRNWTPAIWERRWREIMSFPSLLTMAVARAGNAVDMVQKSISSIPRPGGKVSINFRGSHVSLTGLQQPDDVRLLHQMRPSLEMVQLVLEFGAKVTPRELDAARNYPGRKIFKLLDAHFKKALLPPQLPSPPVTVSPSHTADVQNVEQSAPRFTAEEMEVLAAAEARIVELEERRRQLEARCLELEAAHASRIDRLDRASAEHQQLLNDKAALLAEIQLRSQFVSDNNALRVEAEALREQNRALRDRHARAMTTVHSEAPTKVRTKMVAVANFEPTAPDEMRLIVGDSVFVSLAFVDGWGLGFNTVTKSSGVFPLTYLAPLSSGPAESSPGTTSNSNQIQASA